MVILCPQTHVTDEFFLELQILRSLRGQKCMFEPFDFAQDRLHGTADSWSIFCAVKRVLFWPIFAALFRKKCQRN